jgi:GntR family transcriptional regulator, transcriptional repressor for pyruvate dehydrogenase complex
MKLHYQALSDQAVEALNDYIVANGIAPGEALPGEEALAELFGVSRPVVREALRKLAGMGVVEIAKGKGTIVRPITSDPLRFYFDRAVQLQRRTIIELMEIRMGLEIEGVRLAAERRDEQDVDTLDSIAAEMRAQVGRLPYAELDVRLHLALAAATKNEMLYHLVESIEDALRQTISEGLRGRRTFEELEHVQELHERIVAEVAAARVSQATDAMRAHFDEAIRVLAEMMETPATGTKRRKASAS